MKYPVGTDTALGTIRSVKTVRPSVFPENDFQEYDLYCVHTRNDKVYFTESEIDKIVVKPTGDISDGYHTFDELYYQRAILFSVICRLFPDKAWKSKLHADGTMFEDHFIVGIDTPLGQYTYHYSMAKWPLFPVKNVDRAPKYDGHTADNVTRLFSLVKPKRNIDHLIELWDGGDKENAFDMMVYSIDAHSNTMAQINYLMSPYSPSSRYPKLTPGERKAVEWLVDGGFTLLVRKDGATKARLKAAEGSNMTVALYPITTPLIDSSWITSEPINLADLLAAQEEGV